MNSKNELLADLNIPDTFNENIWLSDHYQSIVNQIDLITEKEISLLHDKNHEINILNERREQMIAEIKNYEANNLLAFEQIKTDIEELKLMFSSLVEFIEKNYIDKNEVDKEVYKLFSRIATHTCFLIKDSNFMIPIDVNENFESSFFNEDDAITQINENKISCLYIVDWYMSQFMLR